MKRNKVSRWMNSRICKMSSSANHQEANMSSDQIAAGVSPVVVGTNNHLAPAQSLIEAQQRQQQELIKLLTQHFHNQFYQLANQSSNNETSQLTGGHQLLPTMEQYQQSQQQQQQQQHRLLSSHQAPTGPFLNAFDLHAMSLLASGANTLGQQQQQQSFLQNRLMRSHQPINDSLAANLVGLPESFCGLNFAAMIQNSAPQPGQYPPIPTTATDMSLFNALGLNLTTTTNNHNQLVLSPQHQQQQQQSSANRQQQQQQAAAAEAAIRQYQSQTNQIQLNKSDSHSCRDSGLGKPRAANESREHDQQDGFLKFSINTILGRGLSPAKSVNSAIAEDTSRCEDDDRLALIEESKSDRANDRRKLSKSNNSTSNHLGSDEHQFRLSGCDLTTIDFNESDSSSVQTPLSQLNVGTSTTTATTSLPLNYDQPDQLTGPMTTAAAPTTTTTTTTMLPMAQLSCAKYQTPTNLVSNHASNSRQQQQQQQHQATCHAPLFLSGTSAFPWTVAARGKPRRGMMRRAVFSDSQRVGLEKRFQLQKYISKPDRKKLAEKLGLRDSQVKIWFQNRRMKWRNSKERELLSAGGSREQTLPTRNNPNPDLSDVGETVKRLASVVSNNSSSNNSTIS